MSRLRLTDAAVRRLRPPKRGQAEYFDELLPSFGLRLSYSGARSWIVMTRVNRELRRITLGRYPATSLEDARREARRVIELAQKGADPRAARRNQAEKRTNFGPGTFGAVAAEFMSVYVGGRQLRSSTRREYQRILQGIDTAHLHGKSLNQITKLDVMGFCRRSSIEVRTVLPNARWLISVNSSAGAPIETTSISRRPFA